MSIEKGPAVETPRSCFPLQLVTPADSRACWLLQLYSHCGCAYLCQFDSGGPISGAQSRVPWNGFAARGEQRPLAHHAASGPQRSGPPCHEPQERSGTGDAHPNPFPPPSFPPDGGLRAKWVCKLLPAATSIWIGALVCMCPPLSLSMFFNPRWPVFFLLLFLFFLRQEVPSSGNMHPFQSQDSLALLGKTYLSG